MKIALLMALISTSTFAGTCKVKAQLWVAAPVVILEKYKVELNESNLTECVEAAQKALNYSEKVSVPVCGNDYSCGDLVMNTKVKKAKFKFTENGYTLKGSVKKNKK